MIYVGAVKLEIFTSEIISVYDSLRKNFPKMSKKAKDFKIIKNIFRPPPENGNDDISSFFKLLLKKPIRVTVDNRAASGYIVNMITEEVVMKVIQTKEVKK